MEKRVQDYGKEILNVVRSNVSPAVLAKRLQDFHENDLADVLEELSVVERCKLYRVLDMDMLSDIFEYTDEDTVVKYLEEMEVKKAAAILSKMETNVLADVLQQFERSKRKILIELLDDKVRHDIELITSFDDDEIGSRMTTNYIVIHENISVKEAMSQLVTQAAENDNISTIFVINDANRLLGVITSANIVDLVDDEMGEDYAKLAGLTAEEDLQEPLKESMKKRMPWLIILLGLGMVVSSVVGIFEKVVTNLPIIMCFQSLILDSGGYDPCSYGRIAHRQTETGTCTERDEDWSL